MRKLLLAFLMIPIIAFNQNSLTYPQRTANYFQTFTDGTAGIFDQGDYQLGMYAHGGGNKQCVAWRKFRTDASGVNISDRSMQIGDEFIVRLSATRAYGKIGVALLASPTSTSSWADRENNYAISVNLDGPNYTGGGFGNWYIKYKDGATAATGFGGDENTYSDVLISFTLTAANRMNVSIYKGFSPFQDFYDIELNTSAPITDYAIFLEDDWDGSSNNDVFWGLGGEHTQHTLTNLGQVEIGGSNNSFTVSSAITDGLDAASSTIISPNDLIKKGTGILTLSGFNSYTQETDIQNGVITLGAPGVIPNISDLRLGGGTLFTNGISEIFGKLIVQSPSTIDFGLGSHNLNFAVTGEEDWGGLLTILNWTGTEGVNGGGTAGKIFVGTDNTGLSALNLFSIHFTGFPQGAVQKADGEVVPAYAPVPGIPSSAPAFNNVYASKMDFSWTNGDGTNRIVVVREGSAVSWLPSNGNDYTANADYSQAANLGDNNKVCYNGAGSSFTLSGLSAGTTYHFEIFEYNGTDATASYLTTGTLTTSQGTSASYQTVAGGASTWSTTASWLDGVVPPDGSSIVVDDDLTLDQNANVSDITINSGATLTASNGKAGEVLTIADGGTLTSNGNFSGGSGKVVFPGTGTVAGTVAFFDVEISGGVDFSSGSTINGTLTIFGGGYVNTNAPAYADGSTLKYSTGGDYGSGAEWTAGSQSGQGVPYNVTVETTDPLRITGTSYKHLRGNLTIASGAELQLSTEVGGDLELEGNFTDNGTFTHNTRLVTFNGTSVQTIGGSSETSFGYFTVAADAQVEVASDKHINIDDDLTVAAAKSGKAAGQFTLKSDATGTASLIIASGANTSGDISVERFLSGGWDWHFLSSPVVDQPIVGAGNFVELPDNPINPTFDFYRYEETETNGQPWINIKDVNGALNTNFGTPTNDPYFEEGWGHLAAYSGGDLVKTFNGAPLVEQAFMDLSYTVDGSKGWNLVGNTYTCAVDWDAAGANSGLDDLQTKTYYIYNEDMNGGGGGYEWYTSFLDKSDNTNGKIPAMQAFFVKAKDMEFPSMHLALQYRVHDDQEYFKQEESGNNKLKFKIEGESYYSNAYIRLNDNGTTGVDENDAFLLFSLNSEVPHVYSLAGEEKLVSNNVPFPDEDYSIPLGIRAGSAGTYTVTAVNIENFNSSILPVLEDTETGAEVDLRFEGSYTFDVTEPGINNTRFILHFKSAVGINDMNQKPEIVVSVAGGELHVYNLKAGKYDVKIMDTMGRGLVNGTLDHDNTISLPANISAGTYILQVSNGERQWVEKFVVN